MHLGGLSGLPAGQWRMASEFAMRIFLWSASEEPGEERRNGGELRAAIGWKRGEERQTGERLHVMECSSAVLSAHCGAPGGTDMMLLQNGFQIMRALSPLLSPLLVCVFTPSLSVFPLPSYFPPCL